MRRFSVLLALALAALQALLLADTAWDKSDTIDEPTYLTAAVHQWMTTLQGDATTAFDRNCEAPALPKWGFALGLRLGDPMLFERWANRGDAKEPDPLRPPLERVRRNLFAARSATMLLTVVAGLFLWSAARAFGDRAALVTHTLWCLSPTILAQGSLATLDGWLAGLSCFAIWAAFRVWRRPGPASILLLGATLGLAAACKVTGLGLVPVGLGIAFVALARRASAERRTTAPALAMGALVMAVGFLFALWAVYGFSVGEIDSADLCGLGRGEGNLRLGPLPFPAWISGLLVQRMHGAGGHLSYLFGEIRFTGWWWFYLACLALKTTIGAQAAGLLGVAAWFKRGQRRSDILVDVAILAFPLLLLVVMSLGRAQNGIRYIAPLFPFAMLWMGRAVQAIGEVFGPRGLRALVLCVALGAIESLAVHPSHLMFFNQWAGGPSGGPRYLVNGDDWGQDQRNLAEFLKTRAPLPLYYTYYNGNPLRWRLDWTQAPCEPVPGNYALHAVEIHRPKRMKAGCLDWLTVEPPDARIGYSIYFYQVTRPRIARLVQERGKVKPFWEGASPPAERAGDEDRN